MTLDKNLVRQKDFRELLRNKLVDKLNELNYELVYDNERLEKGDDNRWIFKLKFTGKNEIEVSNNDWRDYTEYFNIYLDSKELLSINTNKITNINEAYLLIENAIINSIQN